MEIPLIVFGCVFLVFAVAVSARAWWVGYQWRKESGLPERRGFLSRMID